MLRPLLAPLLFAAACASMASVAPARAEPLRVAHVGGELALDATPGRVAVFDLAVLDILHALDVEVAGGPPVRYPAYLAEAYHGEDYLHLGTLFEPDMDALQALDPDLVVLGGRSQRVYPAMSEAFPTLNLNTGTTGFVADVLRNTRTLGRVFGKVDEAEALADRLQASIEGLHAETAEAGTAVVLFLIGGNVTAHAPGARFGILHEVLGLPSVLPPEESGAARPGETRPEPGSPEALARAEENRARLDAALAAEPDWLIVLDRGAATDGSASTAADTLAAHPGVSASPAWQAGRVFYLDPATWYLVGGGATALQQTVDAFSAKLDAAD